MGMVDVVIRIPEQYKNKKALTEAELVGLAFAIQDGTVLPKGHGRLVDVDEVEAILHNKAFDMVECNAKFYTIRWVQKIVRNAPTVIEADKEAENDTGRA